MSDANKVGLDDFIVAHGADKFAELLTTAKPVEEDTDPRPVIFYTPNIHEMGRRVREVLAGVPWIFSRGNVLMEMREKLEPIPKDYLPELLSENVRFFSRKVKGDGSVEDKQIPPPYEAVAPVFARPGDPISEVKAVADHPLMLADGRILDRDGYDAASGTLVRLPTGFKLAPIPDHPTRDDARAAAARLLDVFCDFPFVDDGDDDLSAGKKRGCHSAAAVIAFMLSVVARRAINGPVPMFLMTKNCPGTGGTLLVETCALIVAGRHFDVDSYPHEHREMRLMLLAWAMEGRTVAFLDNLVGVVGDAELCGGITSTTRTGRILGGSKTYSGPFTTVIVGTSNNAILGADMPRRVIPVRLETDMFNPERRERFKHDLSTYPLTHRPRLLADLFTMLKAWQLAGRPQQDLPTLGKFEAWSRVVRQACVFAGLADPYLRTPAADNTRTRLIRTIAYGIKAMDTTGKGMTAAAICKKLTDSKFGEPQEAQDAADAAAELLDRITPVALGKILAQEKGRNLDGIKIVEATARDHRMNVAKWTTAPGTTTAQADNRIAEKPLPPPDTPIPSPATPANEMTTEQPHAGDAGVENGVCGGGSGKNNKRSGRVKNNPHKGTVLDKEVGE